MSRVPTGPRPFLLLGGGLIALGASALFGSFMAAIMGFTALCTGFALLVSSEWQKLRLQLLIPLAPLLAMLITPALDLIGMADANNTINIVARVAAPASLVAAVLLLVWQWSRSRALWFGIGIAAVIEMLILTLLAAGREGASLLPFQAAAFATLGITTMCIGYRPAPRRPRARGAQQP